MALSGLKYGADLVLYQAHPADCHADFCVIALPAEPPPPARPSSPGPDVRAPYAGSADAGAGSGSSGDAMQSSGACPGGAARDVSAVQGTANGVLDPAQALMNGHSSCPRSTDIGASAANGVANGHALNGTASRPVAEGDETAAAAPDLAAAAKEGKGPRLCLGSRVLMWNDLEAANRLCTQVRPACAECAAVHLEAFRTAMYLVCAHVRMHIFCMFPLT